MRRTEAAALLTAALAMVVGGLVWLLGAIGLIIPGVLLAAFVLLVVEIKE
ncbi:hypothetical protein [Nonomuraea typhae]|nr:hypothetical protein [Nonomuraea typhae]